MCNHEENTVCTHAHLPDNQENSEGNSHQENNKGSCAHLTNHMKLMRHLCSFSRDHDEKEQGTGNHLADHQEIKRVLYNAYLPCHKENRVGGGHYCLFTQS